MRYYDFSKRPGFTVVELIIVIVVIGILAAVTIVGYSGWQKNIAKNEVVNALTQAGSSMESSRNFKDGYPSAIPDSFKSSESVNLILKFSTGKEFCIEASNKKTDVGKYYLNSNKEAKPTQGSCPAQVIPVADPAVMAVTVVDNQATVSWSPVTNATGYTVEYRQQGGAWGSSVTKAGSSHTYTGLPSYDKWYEFRVRASNSTMTSGWSPVVSRVVLSKPVLYGNDPPVCGNYGGGVFGATNSWMDVWFTFVNGPADLIYSYKFEGTSGITYGKSPAFFTNVTGSGARKVQASTSYWTSNQSGSGSVNITAIGPNGEKSAPTVWVTPTYGPYEC